MGWWGGWQVVVVETEEIAEDRGWNVARAGRGIAVRVRRMRVLVAFDKFKDALTAPAACEIATRVIAGARPDWETGSCPLADGGEGFATILTAVAGGQWVEREVTGPIGRPCSAGFGLVKVSALPVPARDQLALGDARTVAVIEMATASGLQSLNPEERDPWQTDTRGTGELIRAAAEAGADAILLGVGGSATNDLGLGALTALGWQARRADGSAIGAPCPATWADIASLHPGDVSLPAVRIACDVANPLLGDRGATAVFGPQKGLKADDFPQLETQMTRLAGLLGNAAGRPGLEMTPGAGAAGGIAYGLLAAADARLVPGFDLVEAWLDIGPRLAAADLVITGEGRFDASSLEGKGPGSLALRAAAAGKSVWVLAGSVDLPQAPEGCEVSAISPPDLALLDALRATAANLELTLREKIVRAGP